MDDNQTTSILRAFISAGDGALKLEKSASAEHFYEEALRFAQNHLGSRSPETALANFSLSMFYLEQQRLSEAASYANAALDIFTIVFGSSHPTTGMALHHLAEVCVAQNLPSVASPIRRRATEIMGEHIGALDFSVPTKSLSSLMLKGMMKGDGNWMTELVSSEN